MILADFHRLVDSYLNRDQPTLQVAITQVRDFCRSQQRLNEIHAYSVRGGHRGGQQNGSGLVIDVQTTPTGSTHQLFFSEAGWMGHTATNPAPQDTSDDAYDRAMRGL